MPDDVNLTLKKLDPEDAVLALMEMFHEFDDKALALEFVLRMAWNGGSADGRPIDLTPL